MNRAGLLIIGAVIVAVAALGAIFWTDLLGGKPGSAPQAPSTPTVSSGSPEAQLAALMNQIQSTGGHSATFTDEQIRQWSIADGHKLERLALDRGVVMARLSSSVSREKQFVGWGELGLSWMLPIEFANAANGKEIEIGVVARSAQNNPSPVLSAIYATQQAGNSDWRELSLTPAFSLLKFTYQVPSIAEGYRMAPVLVLQADAEGRGRSVEVLGAYVKIIQ